MSDEGEVKVGTSALADQGEEEAVKLTVLPIYDKYLKEVGNYRAEVMRLTFLEVQLLAGHALTWPDIK